MSILCFGSVRQCSPCSLKALLIPLASPIEVVIVTEVQVQVQVQVHLFNNRTYMYIYIYDIGPWGDKLEKLGLDKE